MEPKRPASASIWSGAHCRSKVGMTSWPAGA
jgi:hypothetical protein